MPKTIESSNIHALKNTQVAPLMVPTPLQHAPLKSCRCCFLDQQNPPTPPPPPLFFIGGGVQPPSASVPPASSCCLPRHHHHLLHAERTPLDL
ncbi:Hypothetical predicted protein [Scomber scombrus]|uniref:Uncharacterized protein n=1 Tax=Scomber scombrus TaxID=13677 RepID=A0AAV1N079_SCOSC